MKRSQSAAPVARFVHVDTAQLEENHEFELCKTQSEQASSGEKSFKLRLLEHPLQEVCHLASFSFLLLKTSLYREYPYITSRSL